MYLYTKKYTLIIITIESLYFPNIVDIFGHGISINF